MEVLASLMLLVPLTLPSGLGKPEGVRHVPPAAPQAATPNTQCEVTKPVQDRPPDDPHASSFQSPGGIWYANSDRTLWAWWWGRTSTGSYKVLWVRPAGSRLKVQGRRVDGPADPLIAQLPDLYPWTYQASGLSFPAAGCWRVEATAGDSSLTFVVRIP